MTDTARPPGLPDPPGLTAPPGPPGPPGLTAPAATAAEVPRWYARPAARAWNPPAAADGEASSAAGVQAFHASIPGYAPTPLTEFPALAAQLNVGRVFVKDESWRLGLPAFKVLGASWAVARLVAAQAGLTGQLTFAAVAAAARGAPGGSQLILVTATDGNHGRAVARMAALLGLRAQVFVPRVISPQSAAAIAAEGAAVTAVDGTYDEAVARAAGFAAEHPADRALVQDTGWPGYEEVPGWVVAGYATLSREIDAQLGEAGASGPALVAVPVGVGSLAQAIVGHYRCGGSEHRPAVLAVEPDTAACVLVSLSAGKLSQVSTAETIMAGLNCGTPSSICWPMLRAGLDAAIAVSDHDTARAVSDLAALGLQAGPSGAASLAGARSALTGPGCARRRAELAVGAASVVVLLSTEGRCEEVSPRPAPERLPGSRPADPGNPAQPAR